MVSLQLGTSKPDVYIKLQVKIKTAKNSSEDSFANGSL